MTDAVKPMTDAVLLLLALVAGLAGGVTAAWVFSLLRKPAAPPVPPPAAPTPAPAPRSVHPDRVELLLREAEQASRRLERLIRRSELLDPAHDSSLPGLSTNDIESDPMEIAVREGLSQGESAESLAEALGVSSSEIEEMIARLQSTSSGSEAPDG